MTYNILRNYGLDEREIKIYLSILDLGRPTIKQIQNITADDLNLSYSQIYSSIKKMLKFSLIEEHPSNEHTFTPVNPEIFLTDLKKKKIRNFPNYKEI